MNQLTTKFKGIRGTFMNVRIVAYYIMAGFLLVTSPVQAAVQGITGAAVTPSFNLTASANYSSQPDGAMIYSWGYGCTTTPAGFTAGSGPKANCPVMQLPGPTMVVNEGDAVTVTLTNSLPEVAGNTSIVFPGFNVSATGGVAGLLVGEATHGGTVTYTFTAIKPGTYAYYSGTQADLQMEMGLYGAIVVLPKPTYTAPANCKQGTYSLAKTAYDHNDTCYDREYLFQFSEIDSKIHDEVLAQVNACPTGPCSQISVTSEPYSPNYFLINGRSLPDLMDISFSSLYPNQPYNGNPHMHPGEKLLMRVVGQGRWQHPFHFHGNHARVLARDGNLILSQTLGSTKLAGPLLFTISTVSGQTVDAIFEWTGQGLNWDVYNSAKAHTCNGKFATDVNGLNKFTSPASAYDPSSTGFDPATHEYCSDHGKPIPVTPPDPALVANGQWYGGTPYLGIQSNTAGFNSTPLPPGTLNFNSPQQEAGYAYMWHSHNEREITTNDVFPGGMMMMLIIDPYTWTIDETL